jgi:uncharacterized membrane protein YkoI
MKHPLLIAALLAAALPSQSSVGQDDGCIGDWSVAAPIVRKEGLVSVEELSAQIRARLDASIVKTTLCQEKGDYAFRLVVRGAQGQLKSLTLDARAPFSR